MEYNKNVHEDDFGQTIVEYDVPDMDIVCLLSAIDFLSESQEEVDTKCNYVINGMFFVGLDLINEIKNIQEM